MVTTLGDLTPKTAEPDPVDTELYPLFGMCVYHFALLCGYSMGNFYKQAALFDTATRTTKLVKPDGWGTQARIRLSNALGKKPVTFDDAFIGLQESGSAVLPGTNMGLTFKNQKSVTVPPGVPRLSTGIPTTR